MATSFNQIEIFRTTVDCPKTAYCLVLRLQEAFPYAKCNFDLDDCDRILRVDSPVVIVEAIAQQMQAWGYRCEWIA